MLTAWLLAVALPGPAAPGPGTRRGPIESREEWLLVQPLLNLPAVSPDPLPAGRTVVRLDLDWGNDFGWEAGPMGRESDLRYIVDGEHRTAALGVRRGLGRGITVGLRLPVRWRGGGLMDSIIDPFHGLFNFPDSGRLLFPRNQLRVDGHGPAGAPFGWQGRGGTGLGNLELEAHIGRGRKDGCAVALVGRGSLPTGSGPFAGAGAGVGGQAVTAAPLGSWADLYAGIGGTLVGRPEVEGVLHERGRLHGFLALEVRPFRAWSLLLQADAAGRVVRNLDNFPDLHLYLKMGSKVGLGARWTIEGGFTEGLADLENTTDFGVFLALARGF